MELIVPGDGMQPRMPICNCDGDCKNSDSCTLCENKTCSTYDICFVHWS